MINFNNTQQKASDVPYSFNFFNSKLCTPNKAYQQYANENEIISTPLRQFNEIYSNKIKQLKKDYILTPDSKNLFGPGYNEKFLSNKSNKSFYEVF